MQQVANVTFADIAAFSVEAFVFAAYILFRALIHILTVAAISCHLVALLTAAVVRAGRIVAVMAAAPTTLAAFIDVCTGRIVQPAQLVPCAAITGERTERVTAGLQTSAIIVITLIDIVTGVMKSKDKTRVTSTGEGTNGILTDLLTAAIRLDTFIYIGAGVFVNREAVSWWATTAVTTDGVVAVMLTEVGALLTFIHISTAVLVCVQSVAWVTGAGVRAHLTAAQVFTATIAHTALIHIHAGPAV